MSSNLNYKGNILSINSITNANISVMFFDDSHYNRKYVDLKLSIQYIIKNILHPSPLDVMIKECINVGWKLIFPQAFVEMLCVLRCVYHMLNLHILHHNDVHK